MHFSCYVLITCLGKAPRHFTIATNIGSHMRTTTHNVCFFAPRMVESGRFAPMMSAHGTAVFTHDLCALRHGISAGDAACNSVDYNQCACYTCVKSSNPEASSRSGPGDGARHIAPRFRTERSLRARDLRCRPRQSRKDRDATSISIHRVTIRFGQGTRCPHLIPPRIPHQGTFGRIRRRNPGWSAPMRITPPGRSPPMRNKVQAGGGDQLRPWVVYCGRDYGAFERSEL